MGTLQQLLVNKLCRQDYTLVADVLKLCVFEHAASMRSGAALNFRLGENEHVLKAVARQRYNGQLTISMGDGSRSKRLIERHHDPVSGCAFLVGEGFDPDCRNWPQVGPQGGRGCHPIAPTLEANLTYITRVRTTGLMSHEVHTEALNCTSDRKLGMLIYGLFPMPPSDFFSIHHLRYFYRLVQLWHDSSIRCLGVATDSCSTGLGAGTMLMTPTSIDIEVGTRYLGLPDRDFVLLAPHLGGRLMDDGVHYDFCTKWYGDAPHLARTLRRNLCYETRCLVFTQVKILTPHLSPATSQMSIFLRKYPLNQHKPPKYGPGQVYLSKEPPHN